MERSKQLYWVDVGLAISFLIVFITGLAKFRKLAYYFSWLYEIIPPREMAFIHDWSGIVMGVFVLIHLIQHWTWIKVMTKVMFIGKNKKTNGK